MQVLLQDFGLSPSAGSIGLLALSIVFCTSMGVSGFRRASLTFILHILWEQRLELVLMQVLCKTSAKRWLHRPL
jgi:hypothetical protein